MGSRAGLLDRAHIWLARVFPFLLIAIVTAPLIHIYVLQGVSFFDSQTEFVAYRVSDALSIHFGQAATVHPVQGIPSALISKYVTLALFGIYDTALLTRPVLQIYGLAVIATFGLLLLAAVIVCNKFLHWPDRAAMLVFAIFPWVAVGPSIGLLAAPEYWLAEFFFLLAMFGVVAWLRRGDASPAVEAAAIGAVMAVAFTLKVSLSPLGLLLLAVMSSEKKMPPMWRLTALAAATFVVTYVALCLLYMSFDLAATGKLMTFQLWFYTQPNASHIYPDMTTLLARNPALIPLVAGVAVLTLLIMRRQPLVAFAALIWVAVLCLLLVGRRHDTSVTSATAALLFLLLTLALMTEYRLAAAGIATAVLAIAPIGYPHWNYQNWMNKAASTTAASPDAALGRAAEAKIASFPGGVLIFLPDNNWNPALIQQAFAYNGALAKAYSKYGDTGPVLEYFTPGVHVTGPYPQFIAEAAKFGVPVVWTRPLARSREHEFIDPLLIKLGYTITRIKARLHSRDWEICFAERGD